MTPNADGLFDTWHITGVKELPGTMVTVFDRYGKLIKTLGQTEFEAKGHFTLRR